MFRPGWHNRLHEYIVFHLKIYIYIFFPIVILCSFVILSSKAAQTEQLRWNQKLYLREGKRVGTAAKGQGERES